MIFENIETWGVAWGYLFVVVIAGASLFVGLKKKQMIAKKKLQEKLARESSEKPSETKPDLEQVGEKKTDDKKTDEKQSAFADSEKKDKDLT